MTFDASFFVALAFVLVMLGFWRLDLHGRVIRALDARAETIKKQLDEAASLHDEAQKVLRDYRKRARDIKTEAQRLVDEARQDAERIAAETKTAMQDRFSRRIAQVDEKIASIEAQMIEEIKHEAASLAIGAAKTLIVEKMSPQQAEKLVSASLTDLETHLSRLK